MSTINLQTPAGVAPEKDELNRSEKSDAFKRMTRHKKGVIDELKIIKQLNQQDRESLGLEDAYIDRFDLIDIIETLLANKSSVSKAFAQHEVNRTKCAGWASSTIKKPVDEAELRSALDTLAKNTDLILMKKYDVLDISDILRSASYSAALTKLKKQLVIANRLQDKDNELINKDIIIAAQETKIVELKQELVRNKSKDWEPQAVALYQAGVTIAQIALRLGISRGTIYKHFKIPSIKDQLLNRPIQA